MPYNLSKKISLKKLIIIAIFIVVILIPLVLKLKNGYIIKEQTEYKLVDSILKPLDLIYFPLAFFPNNLPNYELIYSQKDFEILEKDLPKTVGAEELERQLVGRQYIEGIFIASDKKYKVELTIKGEGLANYANHKKTLRVKFINEPFQGRTIWAFVVPEQRKFKSVGASEFIARKLNVLIQQWDYVNLRINDEQMGVYEMIDETDTSFLEHNKLSPNDLVFREKIRPLVVSGNLNMSVFGPEGSWEIDNIPENDDSAGFSAIENLKSINKLEGPEFYSQIRKIIDMDQFLKWSSIMYLLNDQHQSDYNNARLIYLKEKGQFWFIPDHIFVQPINLFVDKIHRHSLNEKILNYPPNFWKRNEIIWSLVSDPTFEKNLKTYLDEKINKIKAPIYQDSQKAFRYLFFKKTIDNQSNIIFSNIHTIKDYFTLYDISTITTALNNENNNIIAHTKIQVSSFFQPQFDALVLQFDKIPDAQKLSLYYDINENMQIDDKDLQITTHIIDKSTRTQIIKINTPLLAEKFNTSIYDAVKPIAMSNILVQSQNSRDLNLIGSQLSFSNLLTGEKLNVQNEFSIPFFLNQKQNLPEFITKISNDNFIIKSGNYLIKNDIEIPAGNVVIEPGTSISLGSGVSIISRASIHSEGTKDKPILITSSDNNLNWGSLVILNAISQSVFKFTTIEFGSGYVKNGIVASGALSVHFSDLIFDNSRITKSKDDDAMNVKHGRVQVTNSRFDNNNADHIDFDSVEGEVANNILNNENSYNRNSDGLDISFSEVTIKNNTFFKSTDKCISVGEESDVIIQENIIEGCNFGIAIKDGAKALISKNNLKKNNIAIGTYLKKNLYGFGGEAIIADNSFEENGKDLDEQENSKITKQ